MYKANLTLIEILSNKKSPTFLRDFQYNLKPNYLTVFGLNFALIFNFLLKSTRIGVATHKDE